MAKDAKPGDIEGCTRYFRDGHTGTTDWGFRKYRRYIDAGGEQMLRQDPQQVGRQMVEQAKNESPESSVVIIADEKSATGVLIDLMDQIRLGGVANIAVAAEQTGGG